MTLQQLHYVVALDTHRHFVRAAQHCHVAQPTLTLQLKKLEDQLGVTLFDRRQKPLRPTPLGVVFVEKARQILREVDELRTLVRDEQTQLQGEFRLGVIPTVAPYLLPRFIAEFRRRFPETQLRIQELQSEAILDELHRNELDFGLLATPLHDAQLRELPLLYEPFLVYANAEHPILQTSPVAPERLEPDQLWLLSEGHCFREHALRFCDVDPGELPDRLTMEAGSIQTLKGLVKQLSGYTLIPELSYDAERDAAHCVRFAAPQPVREVSLVVHRNFARERLLQELRAVIVENVPQALRQPTEALPVEWRSPGGG